MKEISVADYKKAITRGLGRAIIALENSSDIEKYRGTVLWACLNNTCYDAQSEGSRASYLYEALSKFGDSEYFQEKIIAKFEKTKHELHLFEQLAELLICFARDGSQTAKNVLYKKYGELFNYLAFRKVRKNSCPYCDERDCLERLCVLLRELDGFSAFQKIVSDLGAYYRENKNTDPFGFDWFYENSKYRLGSKKVLGCLEKAGITYEFFHQVPNIKSPLQCQRLTRLSKRARRLGIKVASWQGDLHGMVRK